MTSALRLRRYSIPPCESPRTRDRHRAKTQHARGWKAPHNNSGREHTNCRPNNRRDRRSGSVPQRCGIRKLYRCCSSPPSVWEEAIFRQTRHSTGKRPPQTRPLDARLGRHPPQSLAAYLLPTPRSAGKRPKIAIIAAMHKLLTAIYSVAKHRTPFVPQVPATLT